MDLAVFLVGVAYAATLILFVMANKLTTSANTIFLQATAPVYLLLLGPLAPEGADPPPGSPGGDCGRRRTGALLRRQRPARRHGARPRARQPAGGGERSLLGRHDLRASAGCRASERGSAAATVVAGNLIAFSGACRSRCRWKPLGHGLGGDPLSRRHPDRRRLRLLTRGLSVIPALEASLLLMVEPVLNPVWSWLVHGERPTPWALLGGALIIGATTRRRWSTRAAGRGGGAFMADLIETIRIRNGVAPLWYLHLRRLAGSCGARHPAPGRAGRRPADPTG